MKKIYLKSFCARYLTLLVLALLSTNLAWGTEAALTSVSTKNVVETKGGSVSITFGDVTCNVTRNSGNQPGFYTSSGIVRYYSTDVMTLSVPSGSTISQIVFVMNSGTVGTASPTGLSTDSKTWTGNANSVSFTGSGTVKITSITVTYSAGDTPSKELVSLAVSGTPDKTNYKSNEEFDPAGLTVTGTYDDASTAPITSGIEWTVTPSGALTVGTTSVSVTATVNEITSSAYVVNGLTVEEFVQTYANTYTSNVTLSTEGGTSASTAKVVIGGTEYDAIKAGTKDNAGACVVTIPANTKTLHFHAAGWKGETVVLNETINLVADAGVSNNTPFTLQNDPETQDYFTFDPKGATSITIKATSGKRFVLFGVNAELFKTQDVTISSASWATACLPFNATISGNATAYYVIGTEGNVLTKVEADVIPAGEGILLKSNDGGEATVTFTESAEDADAATGNMMKGAITETTFNESGYKYYILANGGNGLGFYYQGADNTTGSSAKCATGKAVLAIPTSSSAKAFISLDNEPTGIESIQSSALNPQSSIYNLQGVRVNGNYKGIVIMNGKKYINK